MNGRIETMVKSSVFKRLTAVSAFSVLTACVSTQVVAPVIETREPATIKIEAVAKKIELHDAVKTDFKVGSLELQKFSIEQREDRLEFKTKLASLLARKDDRMPEEAAFCLEEALRILAKLDTESPDRADFTQLQEVIEAYNSNFISPVPRAIWLGAVPYEALKMLRHSIMNQRAPEATNLVGYGTSDPSKLDPRPSTFWKPGRDVSCVDMYTGFGRASLPKVATTCQYDGPKKSYGVHGGFKLKCDGQKWKFKFGNEAKTEPFNSRLVWALGYNVTPIDYIAEGTRVLYDRALIAEYNSRKDLKVKIKSVLGFTYFSKNIQVPWNPFEDAIQGAILQDGSFVKADRLQAKLIKSIPQKKGGADWGQVKDAKFSEKFEKEIKYLVLREASVEGPSPEEQEELGSWSWKSLDHPDRRELRGFGLITAWVNAFDMRQNNNKTLLIKKADGTTELSHQVSDLGSGFGRASNLLHYNNGLFDKLPWDLVRLRANVGDEDGDTNEDGEDEPQSTPWVSPYKFPHYSVIERNPAFSRMQLDDAKWMTRKLASLSEAQIQDGLIAAGFTAAETKLVLEKLLDRRQQMVDVFGLGAEFPEIVERKINRSISFDPKKDAAPTVSSETKNAAGSIAARKTNQRVVKGHLVD